MGLVNSIKILILLFSSRTNLPWDASRMGSWEASCNDILICTISPPQVCSLFMESFNQLTADLEFEFHASEKESLVPHVQRANWCLTQCSH